LSNDDFGAALVQIIDDPVGIECLVGDQGVSSLADPIIVASTSVPVFTFEGALVLAAMELRSSAANKTISRPRLTRSTTHMLLQAMWPSGCRSGAVGPIVLKVDTQSYQASIA
jgi:hypothetical protein